MTAPRRPTKLEQPPPGPRCPACWFGLELQRLHVIVCPRCFVLVACTEGGSLVRVALSDMTRIGDARYALAAQQASLITLASMAWQQAIRARPAQQP